MYACLKHDVVTYVSMDGDIGWLISHQTLIATSCPQLSLSFPVLQQPSSRALLLFIRHTLRTASSLWEDNILFFLPAGSLCYDWYRSPVHHPTPASLPPQAPRFITILSQRHPPTPSVGWPVYCATLHTSIATLCHAHTSCSSEAASGTCCQRTGWKKWWA